MYLKRKNIKCFVFNIFFLSIPKYSLWDTFCEIKYEIMILQIK